MKKVTIYSTPTCTYCRLAKEFFREHGVSYEEHNVASDLKRREEMLEKSGQMGGPVIVVGDAGQEEVVVGFDQSHLSKLLGL